MREIDISDLPWAEFNVEKKRSEFSQETLGLKMKKRDKGHQRYDVELVTRSMVDEDEGDAVDAVLTDAQDALMRYRHPRKSYSKGTVPADDILTNNTYTAGLRDVAFKSTGVWQLKSGDYINFANHDKAYQIVGDTLLQSGVQLIRLTHKLKIDVPVNTQIIANGMTWLFVPIGMIKFETIASEGQDMQIVQNLVEYI